MSAAGPAVAGSGAPPQRLWTREELGRHLEATYLSGSLPAGAPLPSERSMCEQFGVSRPFVREVLSGLMQRGRIDVVPGRGIFVRELDAGDVARAMRSSQPLRAATPRHLVEARATLERQTVALAAVRAGPRDLAAIGRALHAFDRTEHVVERARADIAFHSLIARASGNPVLATMFGSIATSAFELMLRSLGDPDITSRGTPYHQQILDALHARDAAAAELAMDRHIHLAAETYGDDLDRSLDQIAERVLRRSFGHEVTADAIVRAALEEYADDEREGRT